MNVPAGGTVLLGGLMSTADAQPEPGLSALRGFPLVGRLYQDEAAIKDEHELLILVQAVVVGADVNR